MSGLPKVQTTSSRRLREQDGRRRREAFAEVPPRVEYSLTEFGESLGPVLDSLTPG